MKTLKTFSDFKTLKAYAARIIANSELYTKLAFLFVTSVLIASESLRAQPEVLPGLTAWLSGNGSAVDSVGGNNGTVAGNVTYTQGAFDRAFSFPGAGSYVSLPASMFPFPPGVFPTLSNQPFSIELWFKTTNGGVILGLQDAPPTTNPDNWIPAIYVGTDGKLYADTFYDGFPATLSSQAVVNDNKWHYAATTYDGAKLVLYLDGASVGSRSMTQTGFSKTYYYQLGVGYTGGEWPAGNGSYYYFGGLIDEFRVYNRALLSTDVASLYSSGVSLIAKIPAITLPPQNLAVTVGSPAFFSVAATGAQPLTYQWMKDGLAILGATITSYSIQSAQAGDAGVYTVTVSNSFGSSTSTVATLAVLVPASISLQPRDQAAALGAGTTFTVAAAGSPAPSYQWQLSVDGGKTWSNLSNGTIYSGVTTTTLSIATTTVAMSGYQFRAIATNSGGPSATSVAVALNIAASRLVNVSTLTNAGTGSQTLILGFAIKGIGTKSVLARAIGPTLAQFGVTGTINAPQITLFNPAGAPIGQNISWGGTAALAATFAQVGAFALPANSGDSALLVTLPLGTSTVQVSGLAGATGVALAELYDADAGTPAARLGNFSVRTLVGSGANILLVGFVISGPNPETLLIRGVGPSLSLFGLTGVLPDPRLALYNGSTILAGNDNWGGTPQLTSAFASVGAFALAPSSKDSALLVTLQPGSYTAQLSSISGTSGVGLIEVYELP